MDERQQEIQWLKKLFSSRQHSHEFPTYCDEKGYRLYYVQKDNRNSQTFELVFMDRRCFGKKIPMIPKDFELLNSENEVSLKLLLKGNQYVIWREIFLLLLLNKLLNKRITPHFPYFFNYHFSFDNDNPEKSDRPHVYLCQEKFDGDLKTWAKTKRSTDDWFSCFFQIFFAIFTLQKCIGITHNDLHWGNILVKKWKHPIHWTYRIDKNEFYSFPNQKFLFVLCDFGSAQFDSFLMTGSSNSLKDYRRIIQNIFRWMNQTPSGPLQSFIDRVRNSEMKTMQDILYQIIRPYLQNNTTVYPHLFDLSSKYFDFFQ